MGFLNDIVSTAISPLTDTWNLVKDVTGIDWSRQKSQSTDLMKAQYEWNEKAAENAFNRSVDLASMAQNFNLDSMAMQQKYNEANMQQQFVYNNMLSNAARNVFQMRQSGVNPITGSSSVSSVGLPSQSSLPNPMPNFPMGAVSLGSVGNPSRSVDAASSILASKTFHENMNIDSVTNLNNIKAKTQLEEQLSNLVKMRSDIVKNLSDARVNDAQAKSILATLDDRINEIRMHITSMDRTSQAAQETASAATKQAEVADRRADIAQQEVEVHRESNIIERLKVGVQQLLANIQSRGVDIQERQVASIERLNQSLAAKYDSEKALTDQDILWYAEKVISEIDRNNAFAKSATEQSRLTGKQADYYELRMILDYGIQIARTVAEFLPTKVVTKAVGKALEGKKKGSGKAFEEVMDNIPEDRKSDPQAVQDAMDAFFQHHPEL